MCVTVQPSNLVNTQLFFLIQIESCILGCFRSDFVHITGNLGLILISRHISKCIQNAFSSLVVVERSLFHEVQSDYMTTVFS